MKSNCCKAEMKIVGGDEDMIVYQCLACGNGCEPKEAEEV